MKKILILLCVLFSSFLLAEVQTTYATWTIIVETTAKVPGASCTCSENCWGVGQEIFECRVAKGFTPVMLMVGRIIKFFTYVVALSAVLFIVINGILYSMAWIDQGLKDGAKKRIVQTLLWLIILLLSWVILNAIAPWIYQL